MQSNFCSVRGAARGPELASASLEQDARRGKAGGGGARSPLLTTKRRLGSFCRQCPPSNLQGCRSAVHGDSFVEITHLVTFSPQEDPSEKETTFQDMRLLPRPPCAPAGLGVGCKSIAVDARTCRRSRQARTHREKRFQMHVSEYIHS